MLLARLLELQVPRRLFEEARQLVPMHLYAFDPAGEHRLTPEAPPGCCTPPPAAKSVPVWFPCTAAPGEHLVVCVETRTAGTIGCIQTSRLSRAAIDPSRLALMERFLGISADEMQIFAGTGSSSRLARVGPEAHFPELVGQSAALKAIQFEVRRAARVPLPVLIEGEAGVGKDLVAWLIHARGPWRAGPYITLSSAGVPAELVDSALFGHRRGAFPGADDNQPGLLMAAKGGTLFIDQVDALNLESQARLLRTIETGEVRALGAVSADHSNARIIVATSADLPAAVAADQFRRDLYHRLRVLSIRIPPLRERRDDILPLIWSSLRRVSERLAVPLRDIAPDAVAVLIAAPWPGNVRELIHEIEAAVVASEEGSIRLEHLSPELQIEVQESGSRKSFADERARVIEEWERAELLRGLERVDWNVARLARELGLSKRYLFGRITQYGLKRPAHAS